jgi:hypothetical protein
MQSIASLNLVSNCMPYKMGFCENKKGKSIGLESPFWGVFSIEYLVFIQI